MLKKTVIGIAVGALAISAGAAFAGDYHMKDTLVCSDCHTMHYSVSHNFTDGSAMPASNLAPGGPNEFLLKAATENDLCLTCHDNQTFAPDVMGSNTGSHVREAGGLTTGATPYENWKGHSLGAASAGVTAPGGTWNMADGLKCTTCHSAHGGSLPSTTGLAPTTALNGMWRNLRSNAGYIKGVSPATFPKTGLPYAKDGAIDPLAVITEGSGALGQIATHYSVDNVTFNNPNVTGSYESAVASWCKGCHVDFHGASGDANMTVAVGTSTEWVRHPAAGVTFTAASNSRWNGNTNHVKVMTDGTTFTPSCFSCHKSHGNQNAFGLIYMKGTGVVTEQGDDGTKLPNLCQQCHRQGA